MFDTIKKVRVWVLMPEGEQNLQFNTTRTGWLKTCNYVKSNHPNWQMLVIYSKEDNRELNRYYNYNNKKTFPTSIYEI
ncbi:hypothetical protein HX049_17900 [Myroides odoratimimus]|uniref:hypothetical protein n=1 Tax=Myroides odoratimimus TaxID=76832 RepID=UPI002576448A|nr:hypothetical protein [Myroides odoratimimus]MDM1399010.1 hypothetical protein [Myroides odoratimimus]